MKSIKPTEIPLVIEDGDLQVRVRDEAGTTIGHFLLPAGTDLRPATKGLPDDLCQCPHWGFMVKGKIRMHTKDGHEDFVAGDAFYWAPGHAPEALEDSEYFDFSPTAEFQPVIDHITSGGG